MINVFTTGQVYDAAIKTMGLSNAFLYLKQLVETCRNAGFATDCGTHLDKSVDKIFDRWLEVGRSWHLIHVWGVDNGVVEK